MAYSKKETQITLGLITKNERRGDYVKVSRIIPENNGEESVDIRLMYTSDKEDAPKDENGLSPTTKGVRVKSESVPELLLALYKGLSEEERIEFEDAIEELNNSKEESEE